MLLPVNLSDFSNTLEDLLHEVLGVNLSLLLILGDLGSDLLTRSLGL